VMRGIESRRIDARGYGPAFPIASNDSETGRQLNRRVEIVIDPS
jgi:outer membrane protein OmpA-like peptidoglycan-associated protein